MGTGKYSPMAARKENGIYVVSDSVEVNHYYFEGTADQVKANIDLVVERAIAEGMVGEGTFDFSIETGYYDNPELRVSYYFNRTENVKERDKREAAENKVKAEAAAKRKAAAEKKKLKEDAEYAEFLRLTEKFGVFKK